MVRIYHRRIIDVREVDCVKASWGSIYSLYQRNNEFYFDEDDDTANVLKADATNKEEAYTELLDYLMCLQDILA